MSFIKNKRFVNIICTILGVVIISATGIMSQAKEIEKAEYSVKNESSLDTISEECNNIIELISNEYGLSKLSNENWEVYQIKMKTYLDNANKPRWYNETNKDYAKLACFFDTYENGKRSIIKSDIESRINKKIKTKNIYNEKLATEYAKKFAIKANEKQFKTCEFDCTNFVSQAVYMGGKNMDDKWYAKPGILNKKIFAKYSMEWCNADYFVDYFGTYMTFDNHKDFAANIKTGDIIIYDMQSDDDWDHVGYVTENKVYNENIGYADYKVAQHSRYYHDWASSDNNGWDEMEVNYKNITFAIVRIK
ncbi:MAG: hypothetical protein E7262_06910 [Lachnospiraceae bacterium]|nr:hypothetical protein [Lachnospiraceae bacterium]